MTRRKNSENFLTKLWRLLPELAPSIAWSSSGNYLVVHDPEKLLDRLKHHNVIRCTGEASLGRQFRVYGFSRVRANVLRQLPEFKGLTLTHWVLEHKTLNRASSDLALHAFLKFMGQGHTASQEAANQHRTNASTTALNVRSLHGYGAQLKLPGIQSTAGVTSEASEASLSMWSPFQRSSTNEHQLGETAILPAPLRPAIIEAVNGVDIAVPSYNVDYLLSPEQNAYLDALLSKSHQDEEQQPSYAQSSPSTAGAQDTQVSPADHHTLTSSRDSVSFNSTAADSLSAAGRRFGPMDDLRLMLPEQLPSWIEEGLQRVQPHRGFADAFY